MLETVFMMQICVFSFIRHANFTMLAVVAKDTVDKEKVIR